PDNSRQTNILRTSTVGGLAQARLTRGDHDVRLFAEFAAVKTYDAFLQNSAGNYYFDSIADFQAGNAQTLTYGNAVPSLNPLDAAATFNYQGYTFGLMDTWRVSPTLTVSYGGRYDLYGSSSLPVLNANFVSRYGFSNLSTIKGRGIAQPRFSIDWRPTHRLTLSAGGGLFAASTPDVYLVNSFQNSGVLSNSITVRQANNGTYTGTGVTNTPNGGNGAAILQNVNGNVIPTAANDLLKSGTVSATSTTNALDPNFKIPGQWRATASATYDLNLGGLGDHWRVGADIFYSHVRNQVFFTDLRSVAAAGVLTPDGRQRYRPVTTILKNGLVVPNYADSGSDLELTNTNKGRSIVAVARFDKDFDWGLGLFGSFTYQDVKDQTPATSSTASSNYNNAAFDDANRAAYGISNDQVKYFFKYGVNFNHAFFGDYKTNIALFGESRIGHPFSYTFQDPSSGRSAVFGTTGAGTTGTSGSRYLMYVPTAGDTKVSYESAAFQQAFESFLQTSGLNKYAGQVAPRNVFHSKWFTRVDLHISQEIPTGLGHSRLTAFADIENFTNLLNKNWGQVSEYIFPYNVPLVRVQCLTAATMTGTTGTVAQDTSQACAQYRYSSVTGNGFQAPSSQVYVRQSLYTIRVGARFTF
ncbi:MAG: TonB-dependent receptor, partial [Sphingomonas sp.]